MSLKNNQMIRSNTKKLWLPQSYCFRWQLPKILKKNAFFFQRKGFLPVLLALSTLCMRRTRIWIRYLRSGMPRFQLHSTEIELQTEKITGWKNVEENQNNPRKYFQNNSKKTIQIKRSRGTNFATYSYYFFSFEENMIR